MAPPSGTSVAREPDRALNAFRRVSGAFGFDEGMRPIAVLLVALALAVGACGSTDSSTTAVPPASTAVVDPGDGGNYAPTIDPTRFSTTIDNPYLPFAIGSHWHYEGTADGESETTDVTVLPDHKTVMGVAVVVVRDTVRDGDGVTVEDTYDWYAQDTDGSVWYFGEDVKNYENGKLVDTDGSWEAGRDGALPGIVMPATPQVGAAFRQEYRRGEAEDMFKVTATDAAATVTAGSFTSVVVTTDWNPLEPKVIEQKEYAPGVGNIKETATAGADERSALVSYTKG
jgi:hypothetical protein